MKTYDVKCPICGTVNQSLYLEETDGWMECMCCHEVVTVKDFYVMGKRPSWSSHKEADATGSDSKYLATSCLRIQSARMKPVSPIWGEV